jgi:syntaxin 6
MSVYQPLDTDHGRMPKIGVLAIANKDDTETVTDAESISLKSSSTRRNHKPELAEPLTANTDPYNVFRDELERKLERMDESLAEFLRLVNRTVRSSCRPNVRSKDFYFASSSHLYQCPPFQDTAANASNVKSARKLLKRCIGSAEATLSDLQTAVTLEQRKRRQDDELKVGIPSSGLQERQELIETSRNRVESAKKDANSTSVNAKLLADERAMRRRAQNGDNTNFGATTPAQIQNTDMILNSQARTSLLMKHQDETLDELDVAVTRVGDMAVAISDEVNQQNKMLDEMTADLEHVEEELGLVMGKLARFLKTKDTWQLGTILALTATTVVLFFLVLYT